MSILNHKQYSGVKSNFRINLKRYAHCAYLDVLCHKV